MRRADILAYVAANPRATTAQIHGVIGGELAALQDELDDMADEGTVTLHDVGGYIGWEFVGRPRHFGVDQPY